MILYYKKVDIIHGRSITIMGVFLIRIQVGTTKKKR